MKYCPASLLFTLLDQTFLVVKSKLKSKAFNHFTQLYEEVQTRKTSTTFVPR